jgi:hypothetical protein
MLHSKSRRSTFFAVKVSIRTRRAQSVNLAMWLVFGLRSEEPGAKGRLSAMICRRTNALRLISRATTIFSRR